MGFGARSVLEGLLAGLESRQSRRRGRRGATVTDSPEPRESLSLWCGVSASPSLLPEAGPMRLVLSCSKKTFTKSSPCNLTNVKAM